MKSPNQLVAIAIASLALSGHLLANTQTETLTADKILEKMQSGRGTPERVAAVKTRVVTGTWSFDEMKGGGPFTEYHGNLAQSYYTSDYTGVGTFVMGNIGNVVWEENPMTGVAVKEGFDAANILRGFALKKHIDWKELFKSAELLGEEEHNGKPHYKLKMNPRVIVVDPTCNEAVGAEDDPPTTWFIDKETFELARVDNRILSPMGLPSDMIQTLSDWRTVEGLTYPFTINSGMGGFSWTIKIEKIEHNAEIPKEHLVLSDKVKAALERNKEGAEKDMNAITVEELEERHVATIRSTCKFEDLGKQMAICLPEVMVYLNKIGVQTVSAPFSRYHSFNPAAIDIESGMFVAEPIKPSDRVKASTLPACKAAVAWHLGPYEGLGKSYERVQKWVTENGYESAGAPWEIYWTDPGMEPDPTKWRTQIFQPVKKIEKK